MGINGLLPALKPIAKQVHVRQYAGQRVAVDGYSWLHKGAYCCARELCEGIWTDKFVAYFLSRIQLLRTHQVEPLIVFDGGRLPIKGDEEDSRHRARAEARAKAAAYLAAGNVAAAVEAYQRCVDITPAMAKQVIEELKVHGVTFVVAPYEADAQMAYLARSGQVQLVVTEDSDLLAYSCPRVLYKLDKTGMAEELSLEDLPNCPGLPLAGWTSDQFLQMCVMAGCDFLAPLQGIGLKKAHGVLRKYRSFTKVVKMLRFNGTKVPPDYEAKFQLALWAFRHARVYCTAQKGLVHLAPLPGGGIGAADVDVPAAVTQLEQQQQELKLDFLGPLLPPEVAQGIAEGELDPTTHKPYDIAAIYAGCRRLPAHIAAQLAQLRHAAEPDGGSQPFSQIAAAFSGGTAAGGKPRVGLSRRHAGQSGGSTRRVSGVAAGAAQGTGSGRYAASKGSGRKRSSLGIAKYFQASAAAAPAAGGGSQATAAAGVSAGAQMSQPASGIAAAAAPAAAPGPAVQGIQQSIAKAMHTLGQQLQQREQQQETERQQLLQQLSEQQHQQQQQQQQWNQGAESADGLGIPAIAGATADDAGALPPLKRHCSRVSIAAAAAAAGEELDLAGAPSLAYSASDACPSLAGSDSQDPLRLSSRPQSPAGIGSGMSLALAGGSCSLADGSSSGAEPPGPGSQLGATLLSSDPSFLCGSGPDSSQGLGEGLRWGRGAAVSALSALLTAPGGGGGISSSQVMQDAEPGDSQPLLTPAEDELEPHMWAASLPQSGGRRTFFSQPAVLGSADSLLADCDAGSSPDGCGGSSSGLSLGLPNGRNAAAAAVLDGGASMSLGQADGCEDADLRADDSNGSFKRLQQCLRAGLRKPSQHQQHQQPCRQSAEEMGPRSAFSQQHQQMSVARRHSRFKEQLLRGCDVAAVEEAGSPDNLASPGLDDVLQEQHTQQPTQAHLQQSITGAGGRARPSAQHPHQTPLQLSESSDPSSSGTSNNEGAEAAADTAGLEHLGITHVRKFAKLAHKVVKGVAKQQQQQQPQHVNPLTARPGLLNTQAPFQPSCQPALHTQPEQQGQHSAMGVLQNIGARPAAADRMRLGLSSARSNRKGAKPRGGAAGTGCFAAKLADLRYDASMFVPLTQPSDENEVPAAAAAEEPPCVHGSASAGAAAARKPFKAPWLSGAGSDSRSVPVFSDDDDDDDDVQVVEPTPAVTLGAGAARKRQTQAASAAKPGAFGNFAKFAWR